MGIADGACWGGGTDRLQRLEISGLLPVLPQPFTTADLAVARNVRSLAQKMTFCPPNECHDIVGKRGNALLYRALIS
jgi:hypothetical protein